MRNLIQFIWNNQFTFLFLLLEVIGFSLLTTNNDYHNSRLETAAVSVSGTVSVWQNSYLGYIGLAEENQKLLIQNSMLKEKLLEMQSIESEMQSSSKNYTTIPAQAINSSYNLGNNFVLLNKGYEDGIEAERGVIGPQGVVGIVTKVSRKYSYVMPLIHSQSMVSCRLKQLGYFGILKWDGRRPELATLEDIPNHVDVDSNMRIVTRGGSGIFPPDELVGYVYSTEKNESSGFQSITVRLATNFRRISNVYVVKNMNKKEIDSLTVEANP